MGNLEQLVLERKRDVDEAEGHHHYADDVQINIRVSAHIAAALEGVGGALALGSRTAAARFLVDAGVFDALRALELTLERGPEGDWYTVPEGQSRHDASQKFLADYIVQDGTE